MSYSSDRSPRRKNDAAGFSLLEVLIVVVVIGIIMAITVSTLFRARDKSRQGATIADLRSIATGIEAYTVDYGLPPTTQPFPDLAALLRPYHSQHVPVSDHWGHAYTYISDASKNYSVMSYGKDGVDGADLTPTTLAEFHRDIVVANGRFPALP